LFSDLATTEHRGAAQTIRELLAVYRDHEDLISIGAYRAGANPQVDTAIALRDEINTFLRQKVEEKCTVATAAGDLLQLAQKAAARKK
jgi:flagellar biosynthesis/type III secretory pathway ATPase